MDYRPSDELVVSVSFERKNENPCMVFHWAEPLSGSAFPSDREILWLYHDEYILSLPDTKAQNDSVNLPELCHFFQSKDRIDYVPFRKGHSDEGLLPDERESETRKMTKKR